MVTILCYLKDSRLESKLRAILAEELKQREVFELGSSSGDFFVSADYLRIASFLRPLTPQFLVTDCSSFGEGARHADLFMASNPFLHILNLSVENVCDEALKYDISFALQIARHINEIRTKEAVLAVS